MKFTKKHRITSLCAAVLVAFGAAAVAVQAYDGAADPVISLSYLKLFKETEIDPDIQALEEKIESLESMIQALYDKGTDSDPVVSVSPDNGYEVIQVDAGMSILSTSPCDIMLRSGTAVAVSQYDTQGLSDYTEGVELYNGDNVPVNHMLLIPRGDGRGIRITSATAFVMVRGEFTIVTE